MKLINMKFLFLFFIIFSLILDLSAQNERLMTKTTDSTIAIKWYYKEFIFHEGVNIYRQKEGNASWEKLNKKPYRPGNEISSAEIEKDSSLSLFIRLFENTPKDQLSGFSLLQFVLKSFESKAFSQYLGILWIDSTVIYNEKYRYKIFKIKEGQEIEIGQTEFISQNQKTEHLPPQEIEFTAKEKMIDFVWLPEEQRYYGVNIYRKTGNQSFKKINLLPVMVTKSKNEEGIKSYPSVFYTDTGLVNGQLYEYKFTAIDFFGDESDFSDIIEASAIDLTAPEAPENLKKEVNKLEVKLTWKCNFTEDFAAINIYRSINDVDYQAINEIPITEKVTAFTDRVPEPAGYYYRVGVTDESGNEALSLKIFVEVADVFPPHAPQNLTVESDTGRLVLKWDTVSAPDLYGYLIFRKTRTKTKTDFTLLNAEPINTSFFFDSLPENAQNKFEYYVVAMDTSYNKSDASNIAFNNLIDIIPPVQPGIKDIEITENQIIINWIKNIDSDLQGYHIYRKQSYDSISGYEKINAQIIDGEVTRFADRWAEQNILYTYQLTAIDSNLNESEPSKPVDAILFKTSTQHE